MSDLVAWLTKILDEDAAKATDCIAEVGSHRAGEPFSDGSGVASSDAFPSYPWGSFERELAFMAGPGHPAAVLADIAAKRAIIDLHSCSESPEDFCQTCIRIGEGGFEDEPWPCPTLRLLASAYADRPSYDESWRP